MLSGESTSTLLSPLLLLPAAKKVYSIVICRERERETLTNKFIQERMGCSNFLPISSTEFENAAVSFTNKP